MRPARPTLIGLGRRRLLIASGSVLVALLLAIGLRVARDREPEKPDRVGDLLYPGSPVDREVGARTQIARCMARRGFPFQRGLASLEWTAHPVEWSTDRTYNRAYAARYGYGIVAKLQSTSPFAAADRAAFGRLSPERRAAYERALGVGEDGEVLGGSGSCLEQAAEAHWNPRRDFLAAHGAEMEVIEGRISADARMRAAWRRWWTCVRPVVPADVRARLPVAVDGLALTGAVANKILDGPSTQRPEAQRSEVRIARRDERCRQQAGVLAVRAEVETRAYGRFIAQNRDALVRAGSGDG